KGTRYGETDFSQVFGCEPQIDAGALCITMAQQIANRFQRGSLAQQVKGIGMPEAMGSLGRYVQAAALGPGLESVTHRSRLERPEGRSHAKEKMAITSRT